MQQRNDQARSLREESAQAWVCESPVASQGDRRVMFQEEEVPPALAAVQPQVPGGGSAGSK